MDIKQLKKELKLDSIYGLDAETYWAKDYSLSDKKRGTTDYVIDPRFELQLMAVQKDGWAKPRCMNPQQFRLWAAGIDWSRNGMLAHHTHFDALICSHHYGIKPAFYFDTMSMGRPILPIEVGGSLDKMAKAFGLPGKRYNDILVDTQGRRLADFTADEKKRLATYGGDDIEQEWQLFFKLLPFYSIDELRLIDLTIKMYAQPVLGLDASRLEGVLTSDVERKDALLRHLQVAKSQLTSKPQFARLLREAGCEPPSKVSVKQSEKMGEEVEVFAMAKQDQEFVDLLGHPIERVRQLVEARFAVSSNQMENRCKLLLSRSHLPAQPVYLKYYGAKTGRWSGDDNANWQNLSSKRKEGGKELRASIVAPPGHVLIVADLRQIEARINAWFSGQRDIVEVFRAFDMGVGPDVYRYVAANSIYHKPIEDINDDERFVGKSCELALGFQAGAPRFASMLRIGALGPPVQCTDAEVAAWHRAWRQARPHIVAGWKATDNKVRQAFGSRTVVVDRVVSYEGTGKVGWMHLPGGMAIRYDDLLFDDHGRVSYISKYRRNKVAPPTIERTTLYGGIEVENRTQALARCVIAHQMLDIVKELGRYARIAMSTHDEVVTVVPKRIETRALDTIKDIMSISPAWAPDLPLAVDAHASPRYDK